MNNTSTKVKVQSSNEFQRIINLNAMILIMLSLALLNIAFTVKIDSTVGALITELASIGSANIIKTVTVIQSTVFSIVSVYALFIAGMTLIQSKSHQDILRYSRKTKSQRRLFGALFLVIGLLTLALALFSPITTHEMLTMLLLALLSIVAFRKNAFIDMIYFGVLFLVAKQIERKSKQEETL